MCLPPLHRREDYLCPTHFKKGGESRPTLNEYTNFSQHSKGGRDVNLKVARACACFGERWGAGVETQKNVRGEVGGWGRVPFNEPYASSLSTIYDGA